MAIKNVTILHEQSIFDVVLQYYGDVSKMYDFIKLNQDNIPSIMFNNLNGLTVKYEEQTNSVSNYFSSNQKIVATKYPQFSINPFNDAFYQSINQSFIQSL